VFFPALALVAIMVAAAGPAATAVHAGAVPQRLVTRLETAAIDELLAAAVPGLRAAALAALAALGKPAAAAACAAAEAAERGMSAAAAAASHDATAAAARTPKAAASLAREALPALDFIADDEAGPLAARLVATILTATASATAAHDGRASKDQHRYLAEGVEAARGATRDLIRHGSAATRNGAYAALAAAAEIMHSAEGGSEAAAVAAAARTVMVGPGVTGEIIAGGLSRNDTRVTAATCLNVIANGHGHSGGSPLTAAAATALLPWLPWLECDLVGLHKCNVWWTRSLKAPGFNSRTYKGISWIRSLHL
jgi:hypothetical protein